MWCIMNSSWFDLSSSDSLADRISFDLGRKLVPKRNCAGLRPVASLQLQPQQYFLYQFLIQVAVAPESLREREKCSDISNIYLLCFISCGLHSLAESSHRLFPEG